MYIIGLYKKKYIFDFGPVLKSRISLVRQIKLIKVTGPGSNPRMQDAVFLSKFLIFLLAYVSKVLVYRLDELAGCNSFPFNAETVHWAEV